MNHSEILDSPYSCPLIGQQRPAILVVDDDAVVRRTLTMRLERLGCKVLTAEHGQDALATLARHQAHIAFIDLRMPVMDGLTLLQTLRHDQPLLRSVVLTASTSMSDALSVMELGAAGFLLKPAQDAELERMIRLLAEQINSWIDSLSRIRALQKTTGEEKHHG